MVKLKPHRRDCKICLALCVTHQQPFGAPITGIDCVAWTGDVTSNPQRTSECEKTPSGVKVGNRCWKRRAAIFRCTVAKVCLSQCTSFDKVG